MNRAQGMEERIIPSSCPNISFHFFPLFFFFFFLPLEPGPFRCEFLARSQHVPTGTQERGRTCKPRTAGSFVLFVEIQPAL